MFLSPAHLFSACSTFGHFSHEQIHFDCSHGRSDKLNMNVSTNILFVLFFSSDFVCCRRKTKKQKKKKSITNSTTSGDCWRHTIGKCKKPFIILSDSYVNRERIRERERSILYLLLFPVASFISFSFRSHFFYGVFMNVVIKIVSAWSWLRWSRQRIASKLLVAKKHSFRRKKIIQHQMKYPWAVNGFHRQSSNKKKKPECS